MLVSGPMLRTWWTAGDGRLGNRGSEVDVEMEREGKVESDPGGDMETELLEIIEPGVLDRVDESDVGYPGLEKDALDVLGMGVQESEESEIEIEIDMELRMEVGALVAEMDVLAATDVEALDTGVEDLTEVEDADAEPDTSDTNVLEEAEALEVDDGDANVGPLNVCEELGRDVEPDADSCVEPDAEEMRELYIPEILEVAELKIGVAWDESGVEVEKGNEGLGRSVLERCEEFVGVDVCDAAEKEEKDAAEVDTDAYSKFVNSAVPNAGDPTHRGERGE
ncbi:hypothetical protein C8F04DRAFT_1183324 [Mycena alexandri]|uniref:Uncharacterized protein n=1 Tax=Mycena alexandri TaxID=1745969 RepID=A0AAD6X0F9_9AGAR|nr:hypothetical protein C8F04DRAFT_1183324 [Mycena alexandri]